MIEFETRRRAPPVINLSALIDIAFILVIFIVLGATFQRVEGVEIDLPNADAKQALDHEALVITVPRSGRLRFGEREVSEDRVIEELRHARADHDAVVLLADREAAIQRAVRVLVDAQTAGFRTVSIATRPPQQAKP